MLFLFLCASSPSMLVSTFALILLLLLLSLSSWLESMLLWPCLPCVPSLAPIDALRNLSSTWLISCRHRHHCYLFFFRRPVDCCVVPYIFDGVKAGQVVWGHSPAQIKMGKLSKFGPIADCCSASAVVFRVAPGKPPMGIGSKTDP